jgi:peptidoglycan hydrolase-like protein with peptidoglycan-binding domain
VIGGARVAAWQEILIGAGIITDRPENRDGVYGPATQEAVRSFLEDRGWTNPDGDGVLGRDFYNLIRYS